MMKRRIWQFSRGGADPPRRACRRWRRSGAVSRTITDNVTGQQRPQRRLQAPDRLDGFITWPTSPCCPPASQYIFASPSDGPAEDQVMTIGILGAGFSAPTLSVKQGRIST